MDTVEGYLDGLQEALRQLSRDDIRAVVSALEQTWLAGRVIYLIGNGGSAATASHMMNDLVKMTRIPGRPRLKAIALTDNVPLMTAVANDQDYADVFVEPLITLLVEGDALIAISASGNSPNVVKAVEYAKQRGATVIGFCGSPGGRLAMLADVRVIVAAPLIGQQEDGHMVLDHLVSLALAERIAAHPPSGDQT